MENGFFATLLELIEARPAWLVLAAFMIAFLESLAIVGLFVPGIVLLFLVGAVIGPDLTLFLWCWLAAALGALTGDVASYWIGRRFQERIPGLWPLRHRPDMLKAGRGMFARHGGKTVFIGRFIGPIRPVVPMLAGMLGLRRLVFIGFAVPATVLWAPLYLFPGMLFGASLDVAAELAGRLVLLLLLGVLGIWFVVWLTRIVYEFTARRSAWWMKGLIRWAHRHPIAGRLIGDVLEPGRHQVIPIALLGLLVMAAVVLLVGALIVAPFSIPVWDADRQLAGVAASLRSHFADPIFVAVALAGSMQVMALLAGMVTVVLLGQGRQHAAWHWVVAVAGGWMLAEMTAGVMALILPVDRGGAGLTEVPHRAFTLATLSLGFFAVMLAKDLNARRRKWPYLITSALLAVIAFSNYYLGQASVTGLLAAFALGLGWLALIGIGYRRRARPRDYPVLMALFFYAGFLALAGFEVHSGFEQKLTASQLVLPERELQRERWLTEDSQLLPMRRSRLGSYLLQRFDVQVDADLQTLETALLEAGWNRSQTIGPLDVLELLMTGGEDEARHMPRDFAGRPEDLVLLIDDAEGQRVVLRLWDSGTRLAPGSTTLWLGQVRHVRLETGFLGLTRWKEVPDLRSDALARLGLALPMAETRARSDGTVLISLAARSESPPAQPAAPVPRAAAEGR